MKRKLLKPKTRRLIKVLSFLSISGLGLFLILNAFQDNIVFLYTPSECTGQAIAFKKIRVGGLVKKNSLRFDADGVTFQITDGHQCLKVSYQGIPPDLFREGQGIIAEGVWDPKIGLFKASYILAKHDEIYKPPSKPQAASSP